LVHVHKHKIISGFQFNTKHMGTVTFCAFFCNFLDAKKVEVTSVVAFPHMWSNNNGGEKGETPGRKQITPGYLFSLSKCFDRKTKRQLGLFPEFMKSTFHEIRSVIESYSKHHSLDGDLEKAELTGR
jgi:hypothetical protein